MRIPIRTFLIALYGSQKPKVLLYAVPEVLLQFRYMALLPKQVLINFQMPGNGSGAKWP
jgi:hypothetical protein